MSADVLDRLRAADPARDVDPLAPEELLHELRALPRAQRRRRPRRALFLAPVALAAAAAAILFPTTRTDLAARAYAQTAPAGDEILYVHTTITTAMRTSNLTRDTRAVSERWQQGDRWRVVTDFDGRRYEERRGADGVLRFSDGVTADPGALQDYVERRSPGFIAEFRANYERGTLDDSGTATFAGRPAKRYVVSDDRNRAEYFVDAETGMPLGSIERFAVLSPGPGRPAKRGQGPNGTFTATTVVDSLQHLAPTDAALAQLQG